MGGACGAAVVLIVVVAVVILILCVCLKNSELHVLVMVLCTYCNVLYIRIAI